MMMSIVKIIIIISLTFFGLASGSSRVTYNDLKVMGASCPQRDSCSWDHSELTYLDRSCECDPACLYHDDCCVNAPARRNYSSRHARSDMVCLKYGMMAHAGVFVVSNCSKHWKGNEKVRQRCTGPLDWSDPLKNIPATDVVLAVTYRNLYCAECNNANMVFLKSFQIRIDCGNLGEQLTPEQILADISYNKKSKSWGLYRFNSLKKRNVHHSCDMIFDVPVYLNSSVRFCRSDIVSTCAANWNRKLVKKQCEEYMAVVYDNENGYKNPHCAICNFKTVDHLSCIQDVQERKKPMSFALLLDVNQSDGPYVGMRPVATEECPADHKYDPFRKICRQLYCFPARPVVNGKCT